MHLKGVTLYYSPDPRNVVFFTIRADNVRVPASVVSRIAGTSSAAKIIAVTTSAEGVSHYSCIRGESLHHYHIKHVEYIAHVLHDNYYHIKPIYRAFAILLCVNCEMSPGVIAQAAEL